MTRANTDRPTGSEHLERPKAGGEHSDALESGLPSDVHNPGAGTSNKGTGYKPAGSETYTEKGDYPGVLEGKRKGAAGPIPSTAAAQGVPAKGVVSGGRGASGKFSGTMGSGAQGEPKHKGTMGS